MNLSEQLQKARADRPDEWTMDRFARLATELEEKVEKLKAPALSNNDFVYSEEVTWECGHCDKEYRGNDLPNCCDVCGEGALRIKTIFR